MPASPQLKGGGTRHARLSPAEVPQPIVVPVPARRGDAARCSQPGARRLCRAEPNRAGAVTEGSGSAAPAEISEGLAGGTGCGRWSRDTALNRAGLRGAEPGCEVLSRAVPS